VIEGAVPEKVNEDSTQPVDLTGNPFTADEPTQTAAVSALAAQGHPPNLPTLKQTQPMRIVDPTGPTVPPPMKAKDGKPKSDEDKTAEDTTAEIKPVDAAPTDPVATADTGEVKKPD
jgi:hypothetical protein